MPTINPENYKRLVNEVLRKAGLSSQQSAAASEVMLYADQRGIESHGLILLETYIDRINKGIIKKSPEYSWQLESPSVSVLNGDSGMGHYIGKMAMEKAISSAEKNMIGLVFVNNITHYGASGYYTELAAKQGMIGFSTTNTFPLMAPTGGSERILGNNPISFSVPREYQNPVILDIATSVAAAGKLLVAEAKNEKIPEGWALDKDGEPTTDPHAGYLGGGSLIPLGHHKGYGLSLIMDILAGVLSGSGYGTKVDHSTIGCVMMAINIRKIMNEEEFNRRLEELLYMVQNSAKSDSADGIYLPGEIEYNKKNQREKEGFPVSEKLLLDITRLEKRLNLTLKQYIT